jgi:pimeloyl-ACP methyl ester carboxylesterase
LAAFRDVYVVVMAGTNDRLTPPAHGHRIAERLPGSQVVATKVPATICPTNAARPSPRTFLA